MPVTESIQINITASTAQAVQNVKNLNSVLGSIKDRMNYIKANSAININVPKDISDRVTRLSEALRNLNSKTKTISLNFRMNPEDADEKLSSVSKSLDLISESLRGIKLNSNGLNMSALLGNVDERVKTLEKNMASIAKSSRDVGNSSGLLKKAFDGIKSAIDFVSPSTLKAIKVFASPVRLAGNAILSFAQKVSTLFSSLRRIAMYRLLRTALKEIAQALKEGRENLYQYSILAGTQFSKSLDKMATAALYVKNSLATIAEPIINEIAPLIDELADKFAEFSHKAAEFLASLFGQASYSRAIKYPTQLAEAAGKASKELQKWLGPFDEINRLAKESGSRSAESEDYLKMFETVLVDGDGLIAQLAKRLKEAIKSGDFSGIGDELGTKLSNALRNIKWDDIKKRAQNIASGIGTFIMGFLTAPGMTSDIGDAIGQMLNTAFTFFGTLAKKLDFAQIGKAVGEGIKHILKTFDFETAVGTIVDFGLGFVEFLTNLIATVSWDDVGSKIGELLKNLPWVDIFTKTWELGKTILQAIFDSIGGVIDEVLGTKKGVGSQIAEAIGVGALILKFGSLLTKILPINSAFSDKNRLLQDQTKYTNAETSAVNALSGAFSGVSGVIPGLSGVLGTLGVVLGLVAALTSSAKTNMDDLKDSANTASGKVTLFVDKLKELKNASNPTTRQQLEDMFNVIPGYNPSPATNPTPAPVVTSTPEPKISKNNSVLEAIGVAGAAGLALGLVGAAMGGSAGNMLVDLSERGLIGAHAGGGFVSSDVFLARENGAPEMVGRIGNRTAVANNAQIVEGVAAGVSEANTDVVNAIYAMAGQIVNAIRSSGSTGGGIDWNGMARQLSRVQARQAMSANT